MVVLVGGTNVRAVRGWVQGQVLRGGGLIVYGHEGYCKDLPPKVFL